MYPYRYLIKDIVTTAAISVLSLEIHAQAFQVKDLEKSVGHWEGQLTYLDYSSGKPFTMPAHLKISLSVAQKGYVTSLEYPTEPRANAKDTTYLVGNLFGKARIIDFKKAPDGDFVFITEIEGEDGNEHQNAVLRHIYPLKANTFSIKKEVKFTGSSV